MTNGGALIVLAAGGTGGHVFPAEALAAELLRRGFRLALITDRRGKAYGGALGEVTTHRISAGGLAGRGVLGLIGGAVELVVGLFQARRLLKQLRPAAVVGFGGYAAFPTMFAARQLRIPTALHEQNAVLGRANRAVAPGCRRICTAYPAVKFLGKLANRATLTGMPVRPAVAGMRDRPYQPPADHGPLRLLVLGGSQGARVLSQVIPAALARLPQELRERLHIAQQCRPEDLEAVRAAYAGAGIDAELESFFSDVPERLADAHLVICRSGASTMGELTVIGRPSILVPYPHAIDDHQTANAQSLDAAGGAILMPQSAFTAEALAARLQALLANPQALADMADRARAAGHPDAAVRLADVAATLAGVPSKQAGRPSEEVLS
jgi:UDP-N-acetylglucosamine--N-acetylmuramyl-(pentapeptide) pyrophosphoryl-undecaprenol N-acetylglucosamine transferase